MNLRGGYPDLTTLSPKYYYVSFIKHPEYN